MAKFNQPKMLGLTVAKPVLKDNTVSFAQGSEMRKRRGYKALSDAMAKVDEEALEEIKVLVAEQEKLKTELTTLEESIANTDDDSLEEAVDALDKDEDVDKDETADAEEEDRTEADGDTDKVADEDADETPWENDEEEEDAAEPAKQASEKPLGAETQVPSLTDIKPLSKVERLMVDSGILSKSDSDSIINRNIDTDRLRGLVKDFAKYTSQSGSESQQPAPIVNGTVGGNRSDLGMAQNRTTPSQVASAGMAGYQPNNVNLAQTNGANIMQNVMGKPGMAGYTPDYSNYNPNIMMGNILNSSRKKGLY